jgi:hypothetical protein
MYTCTHTKHTYVHTSYRIYIYIYIYIHYKIYVNNTITAEKTVGITLRVGSDELASVHLWQHLHIDAYMNTCVQADRRIDRYRYEVSLKITRK